MPEDFMNERPQPNRQKNDAIKIIIIVVVCAFLFGTIGYVVGNKKTITPEIPVEPTITDDQSSPVVDETATPNTTANWKTYTNDTENYSIKYPSDWVAEYTARQNGDKIGDTKSLFISMTKIVPCSDYCAPTPYSSALNIVATDISESETLDQAFEKRFGGLSGIEKASMIIGGENAYRAVVDCKRSEGLGCDNPNWFVIKNSKLYTFESGLSYQPIYDQIVSTFQFTPVK